MGRRNRVVPFAVEAVGEQLDGGKFLLADLDPFRVLARPRRCAAPEIYFAPAVAKSGLGDPGCLFVPVKLLGAPRSHAGNGAGDFFASPVTGRM
jgi:hypothetical protein